MKKHVYMALVVILSSATFSLADIDSKILFQSIFPSFNTKKMIVKEISKPLMFAQPIVEAKKPIEKTTRLAQLHVIDTQNDSEPIMIDTKIELLPQSVERTDVVKEPISQKENILVATSWVRSPGRSNGFELFGCDDAVYREYGSTDLPSELLCRLPDDWDTVYKANSSITGPWRFSYVWNYR